MRCTQRHKGRLCHGIMRPGKALVNEAWVHADFIGDYEGPVSKAPKGMRGQTVSNSGPAREASVMKCEECGHSVNKPKWTPIPCSSYCGSPHCSNWMVEPIATLQGLGMTKADAFLVSAAPEMVEEGWKLFMLCLQSERYRNDWEFAEAVDSFSFVLRKAKGKER